jgi:hypothetical protein
MSSWQPFPTDEQTAPRAMPRRRKANIWSLRDLFYVVRVAWCAQHRKISGLQWRMTAVQSLPLRTTAATARIGPLNTRLRFGYGEAGAKMREISEVELSDRMGLLFGIRLPSFSRHSCVWWAKFRFDCPPSYRNASRKDIRGWLASSGDHLRRAHRPQADVPIRISQPYSFQVRFWNAARPEPISNASNRSGFCW